MRIEKYTESDNYTSHEFFKYHLLAQIDDITQTVFDELNINRDRYTMHVQTVVNDELINAVSFTAVFVICDDELTTAQKITVLTDNLDTVEQTARIIVLFDDSNDIISMTYNDAMITECKKVRLCL